MAIFQGKAVHGPRSGAFRNWLIPKSAILIVFGGRLRRLLEYACERHAFHRSQGPELGDYFLDSLFSDIDSLQLFAGMHPVFFERYHRLLSKRFPFAV